MSYLQDHGRSDESTPFIFLIDIIAREIIFWTGQTLSAGDKRPSGSNL
jgi:hypothetical protein